VNYNLTYLLTHTRTHGYHCDVTSQETRERDSANDSSKTMTHIALLLVLLFLLLLLLLLILHHHQ